jgi:three-Cys-motif partner protein
LPKGLDPDDYERDEQDQLPRELVGAWVRDKHVRLKRYVDISGVAVRRKWLRDGPAGATYIDLFSGPGRVRIRDTAEVLPGSPLAAWEQAVASGAPFTQMWIADANRTLCDAASTRLKAAGAPVTAYEGEAESTVDRIISSLNKYALHFAFLDPYNLAGLPFEIIRKLAMLQRMDILIHVSAQDFNRNLRKYVRQAASPLDAFAPGWRSNVDTARSDEYVRAKIFEYWRGLLKTIDMGTAEAAELVTGPTNQPLYWLAFAARHNLALKFWEAIRNINPEVQAKLA